MEHVKHYRFCLIKRYFDTGYSLTSYLKYMIALFGIASLDIKTTLIIGFIYGISCFFLGWGWIRFGFLESELEVSNRFDPFVKQMRKTKLLNSMVSKK